MISFSMYCFAKKIGFWYIFASIIKEKNMFKFLLFTSIFYFVQPIYAQVEPIEEVPKQADQHYGKTYQTEDVVMAADVMAVYPTGNTKFEADFCSAFYFPDLFFAKDTKKLVITFIVEEDGSVSNCSSVLQDDKEVDLEVQRVMTLLGKWTPAVHKGKIVRNRLSRVVLVIKKLNKSGIE